MGYLDIALKVREQSVAEKPYFFIEKTLLEINDHWAPGALDWNRRFQPETFERLVTIEQEINRKTTEASIKALKEALSQYRSHIFGMSEGFRKAKGTAGSLFE